MTRSFLCKVTKEKSKETSAQCTVHSAHRNKKKTSKRRLTTEMFISPIISDRSYRGSEKTRNVFVTFMQILLCIVIYVYDIHVNIELLNYIGLGWPENNVI